jgi:hypothetical protein
MSKTKPVAQVVREEAVLMVAMQRRLFDAGLLSTAAAINEASRTLGWEAERVLTHGQQEQQR